MNEEKNLKKIIEIFIDKWDNTVDVWSNKYLNNLPLQYNGYKLKISYGQGKRLTPPKYPYISFLKDNNIVSNGIYPYITYNHEDNTLCTSLGYSNDNIPNYNNDILEKLDDYQMETYSSSNIDDLIKQVNLNIHEFEKIISNVYIQEIHKINTKNIILYGSPGVGKTHNYQRIISLIENGTSEKEIFDTITNNNSNEKIELNNDAFKTIKDEKRVEFVTFHQSYSYEDFIEGFRPQKNGNIKLENGIFKNISKEALKNKEQNYYIVIDEINRGNISKIFGELITLIEEDKRDIYEVTLPYSKMPFTVPSNLYIIATMNSTDKSIATIDIALRRRFTFLKMKPNTNLVTHTQSKNLMIELNEIIKENIGEDYMLGHSYFMKVQNDEDLEFIKEYKIKPLLEEYFYADDIKLNEVLEILK
jgi:nucleoside-triphosphatase THEP1